MSPQVSVVVSAYQKADFLPRTITSVLNQTFEDFEIIVVDDGSTDSTRTIVNGFVERDNRVRYIFQNNQGPGGARNTGIRNAKAEFIALLDGDDTWEQEKLEYQVQVLRGFPQIDLLFTNSDFVSDVDPDRIEKRENYYHNYVMTMFESAQVQEVPGLFLLTGEDFPLRLFRKDVINLSTVIFRKQVFTTTGGFVLHLRGPEDVDFWVRAALKGHQYAYSSLKTATYFKNPNSLVLQNEITVLEQLAYAQYAYHADDYKSLKKAARALVHDRFGDLIVFYAENWQPLKAWLIFGQGLRYGMNPKNLAYAMASMMGPIPFRTYRYLNSLRKKKPNYDG